MLDPALPIRRCAQAGPAPEREWTRGRAGPRDTGRWQARAGRGRNNGWVTTTAWLGAR